MLMEWLLDRIGGMATKLWRFEVVGGFQTQRLRGNVYLAPTLRRDTR
jgi:hypothetical protein